MIAAGTHATEGRLCSPLTIGPMAARSHRLPHIARPSRLPITSDMAKPTAPRLRLVQTASAALPGYLGGLRQGWAFAWRSLMAAELITYSPELGRGLGQLLNIGRELSQMSLVITSIVLILVVGMAIELLLFAPLERRVLSRRGLTIR